MVQKALVKKLQRFRAALEAQKIPVAFLVLFGSCARGKHHPESDIDVCVVSSKLGRTPIREGVVLSTIAHQIDVLMEVIPCSLRDWQRDRQSPLLHEIRTTGIVVE